MALSALSRHTMLERQFQLRERRVVIPQSKKKNKMLQRCYFPGGSWRQTNLLNDVRQLTCPGWNNCHHLVGNSVGAEWLDQKVTR